MSQIISTLATPEGRVLSRFWINPRTGGIHERMDPEALANSVKNNTDCVFSVQDLPAERSADLNAAGFDAKHCLALLVLIRDAMNGPAFLPVSDVDKALASVDSAADILEDHLSLPPEEPPS